MEDEFSIAGLSTKLKFGQIEGENKRKRERHRRREWREERGSSEKGREEKDFIDVSAYAKF